MASRGISWHRDSTDYPVSNCSLSDSPVEPCFLCPSASSERILGEWKLVSVECEYARLNYCSGSLFGARPHIGGDLKDTLRTVLKVQALVLLLVHLPISGNWGQVPTNSPIPTPTSISIRDGEVGDINGDGILDLIAVNGQGWLSISHGFGNGSHGNRILIDPGPGIEGLVRSLAIGDVAADGDFDVAYAWATPSDPGGFISIYINDAGQLGARLDIPLDLQVNRTPYDLQLADVDGDGRDEAVMIRGAGQLFVGTGHTFYHQASIFDSCQMEQNELYNRSEVSIGTPTIVDLDLDGSLEMIATTTTGYASPTASWTVTRMDLNASTPDHLSWAAYLGTNYDGVLESD